MKAFDVAGVEIKAGDWLIRSYLWYSSARIKFSRVKYVDTCKNKLSGEESVSVRVANANRRQGVWTRESDGSILNCEGVCLVVDESVVPSEVKELLCL